jgi:hypothetical protein
VATVRAKKIRGLGQAFWETGTEGVFWSVQDAKHPTGYDGLFILENGDHLTIFDKDDMAKTLWRGEITLEYESHRETNEYGYCGQAISGCWVHGLQRTRDVEQWATYFFCGYPMELSLGPRHAASALTGRSRASAPKP